MANRMRCGEETEVKVPEMSPSTAAQQTNIAAVTQFDRFLDPTRNALAFAAVVPVGGAVVAHIAIDQSRREFPARCAGAATVEHLQQGEQVVPSKMCRPKPWRPGRHAEQAAAKALGGCKSNQRIGSERHHHRQWTAKRTGDPEMLVARLVGENVMAEITDGYAGTNVPERLRVEPLCADASERRSENYLGRRKIGPRNRQLRIERGGRVSVKTDPSSLHQSGSGLVGLDRSTLHPADCTAVLGAITGIAAEVAHRNVRILQRIVPGFVRRCAPILLRRHRTSPKRGSLSERSGRCSQAGGWAEALSGARAHSDFKSTIRSCWPLVRLRDPVPVLRFGRL